MEFKCFYCPIIQEELWGRIYSWSKWEGYIPSADEIEDNIIPCCWCDKTGYKIWYAKCSDQIPYNRLTENEWSTVCDQLDIPYAYLYEDNKEDNKEDKDVLKYIPIITKRQKKRNRDQKYKRKLRMLWHGSSGWGPGAHPVDINGDYICDEEEEFVRYKRQYNSRRAKYLRKVSNKKIRKKNDIPLKGSGYKKGFDLMWELW